LHLPVVMGTEMNSPGQKFVDDFASRELSPLVPVFLKGAHTVYAHSVLQQKCGLGYTSTWAEENFKSVAKKNKFFQTLGASLQPQHEDQLVGLTEDAKPEELMDRMESKAEKDK